MLMNAHPRAVSHGFRAFVPRNRVESYHRLLDMPTDEVDAWGIDGVVAPTLPGTENWNCDFGLINEDDSFSFATNIYAECFETDSLNLPARMINKAPMPAHSAMMLSRQSMPTKQATKAQYDFQQLSFHSFNNQRASLGGNKHLWSAHDFTSMMHSSKPKLLSNSPYCHTPRNLDSRSLMGMSSYNHSVSRFDMLDSVARSNSLDSDDTSPSTVYSTSFGAGEITSDPVAASFNSLAVNDDMNDGKWWNNALQSSGATSSATNMQPFSFDGLPAPRYNFQPTSGSLTSNWSNQVSPLETVAPQALTLHRPSMGTVSSDSVCNFKTSMLDLSTIQPMTAAVAPLQITKSKAPEPQYRSQASRARQKLPSKPVTRLHVPILPNNDCGVRKLDHSRSDVTKSANRKNSAMQNNGLESRSGPEKDPGSSRTLVLMTNSKLAKDCRPSNVKRHRSTTSSVEKAKTSPCREELDEFLVKSKMSGMSYKEIRRRGGFSEAESTLRGRFRTLTKKKDERVRRPEWEDNDIRLLKKAVRKLSHGSDPLKQKIPWKQVADYIFDNGGSYHFGNATCRKRWDQLHGK